MKDELISEENLECKCGHEEHKHGTLKYALRPGVVDIHHPCFACKCPSFQPLLCGKIIHVGFEGNTTCANPKKGCVMHDPEAKKKALDKFEAEQQSASEATAQECMCREYGKCGAKSIILPEKSASEKCGIVCNNPACTNGLADICFCGCHPSKFLDPSKLPLPQSPWEEEFEREFELEKWDAGALYAMDVNKVKAFIADVVKEAYERGEIAGWQKGAAEARSHYYDRVRADARATERKKIVEMVKGMFNHAEMLEMEGGTFTIGFERALEKIIYRLTEQEGLAEK